MPTNSQLKFIVAVILIVCVIFYFEYNFLVEGCKGLFKGKMEWRIGRFHDHFEGLYAKIFGALSLLVGIFFGSIIIYALSSLLK